MTQGLQSSKRFNVGVETTRVTSRWPEEFIGKRKTIIPGYTSHYPAS